MGVDMKQKADLAVDGLVAQEVGEGRGRVAVHPQLLPLPRRRHRRRRRLLRGGPRHRRRRCCLLILLAGLGLCRCRCRWLLLRLLNGALQGHPRVPPPLHAPLELGHGQGEQPHAARDAAAAAAGAAA